MTAITQVGVRYSTVDEHQVGQRLDNFLMSELKGVPRSHVYQLIRKGEVRVNKGRSKPLYRLEEGDIVRIPPVRSKETHTAIPPDRTMNRLESAIIYEDDRLIVLNKPAGMAVHGGSGLSFGIIEALRASRPKAKFLELVHRLDRETSGILLIAKKSSFLKTLHELIRTREMQKIYTAVLEGKLRKSVTVNQPLLKIEDKGGQHFVIVSNKGKEAISHFKPITTAKGATLVEVSIETGRTHQIRVHAQCMEHAIIGDRRYGNEDLVLPNNVKVKNLMLHASRLEFSLEDKLWSFQAPLPEHFNIMQQLREEDSYVSE